VPLAVLLACVAAQIHDAQAIAHPPPPHQEGRSSLQPFSGRNPPWRWCQGRKIFFRSSKVRKLG
jgi:hypothetical protein